LEGTQNGEGKSYLQINKPEQVENGAKCGPDGEGMSREATQDHKVLDRAAYEAIVAADDGNQSVLAEMLSGNRSQYDEILEETNTNETESDSLTQTNTETGSLENGAPDEKKGLPGCSVLSVPLSCLRFRNSMDVIYQISFFFLCFSLFVFYFSFFSYFFLDFHNKEFG
jgi:hypothetical protein